MPSSKKKLFRVWAPPKARADLQTIVQVLNNKKSWFGHSGWAFQQIAMATDSKDRADWIVDFATDEDLAKLKFGGLSVTMTKTDSRGRYVETPVTLFNSLNWNRVPPQSNYDTLDNQRIQVINHEFGHVLGEGHRVCTNGLAPIMLQQTKGLHGCAQNPWPLPFEIEHAIRKGLY